MQYICQRESDGACAHTIGQSKKARYDMLLLRARRFVLQWDKPYSRLDHLQNQQ